MELTEDMRREVDRVIRDRFAGKVVSVEFEPFENEAGENALLIRIMMSRST